ncbi:hypothetical protein Bca4012_031362 [Brassica carinata]
MDMVKRLSTYQVATSNRVLIARAFSCFVFTEHVAYMVLVGSFLFNSFLSRFFSCIGTAVLAEFKSVGITLIRVWNQNARLQILCSAISESIESHRRQLEHNRSSSKP